MSLAGAKTAETTAEGANTVAVGANAAAWYAHPIVWILAIIIAVVAALALLAVAIAKSTSALNSDAEAAKAAAKRASELQEAYTKVREEYQKFIDTISDYKKAQEAIDKMVAGTDEWREAITEANAQVMELIQTYPELARYLSNENGRLTISEEGIKAVEQKKQNAVDETYRMSLTANRSSVLADAKLKRTEMRALNYNATGAYNTWTSDDQMKEIMDLVNSNPELFVNKQTDAIEAALKETGKFDNIALTELSANLVANSDALIEATAAQKSAEAVSDALTKEIGRAFLQDNKDYNALIDKLDETLVEQGELKREDYKTETSYQTHYEQKFMGFGKNINYVQVRLK